MALDNGMTIELKKMAKSKYQSLDVDLCDILQHSSRKNLYHLKPTYTRNCQEQGNANIKCLNRALGHQEPPEQL
jgi:hypothetical protein